MTQYYDGTKLLSLLDINKKKPELYICTANRSAGKTTFFNRYLVKKFKETGEKFLLLYRYSYELDDVADKFFKDINTLFFRNDTFESKKCARGAYTELLLNGSNCGYAVALNNADNVKRYSHMLSDTKRGLMDEFQSETNHYCSDELNKLLSVHTSVARGQGEQVRYVPFILIGNAVTMLNPYYTALGISNQLTDNTKFLRGDGFVLESGFIETASQAQKESGFNRAFKSLNYVQYASENVYLNDNNTFVEKINENYSRYICTLRYKGKDYSIKEYATQGIIYCDDSADSTFRDKIVMDAQDHNINYVMLKKNDLIVETLRYYFTHGCFRFKNLSCKDAILNMLSYH